ncbi:hypothetical protein, partial [Nocardia anaemiae]|uniref:hypothetical protein n=1 Tax=Nocardia anaemiae TaxID=263910 RepID=UPI000AC13084
ATFVVAALAGQRRRPGSTAPGWVLDSSGKVIDLRDSRIAAIVTDAPAIVAHSAAQNRPESDHVENESRAWPTNASRVHENMPYSENDPVVPLPERGTMWSRLIRPEDRDFDLDVAIQQISAMFSGAPLRERLAAITIARQMMIDADTRQEPALLTVSITQTDESANAAIRYTTSGGKSGRPLLQWVDHYEGWFTPPSRYWPFAEVGWTVTFSSPQWNDNWRRREVIQGTLPPRADAKALRTLFLVRYLDEMHPLLERVIANWRFDIDAILTGEDRLAPTPDNHLKLTVLERLLHRDDLGAFTRQERDALERALGTVAHPSRLISRPFTPTWAPDFAREPEHRLFHTDPEAPQWAESGNPLWMTNNPPGNHAAWAAGRPVLGQSELQPVPHNPALSPFAGTDGSNSAATGISDTRQLDAGDESVRGSGGEDASVTVERKDGRMPSAAGTHPRIVDAYFDPDTSPGTEARRTPWTRDSLEDQPYSVTGPGKDQHSFNRFDPHASPPPSERNDRLGDGAAGKPTRTTASPPQSIPPAVGQPSDANMRVNRGTEAGTQDETSSGQPPRVPTPTPWSGAQEQTPQRWALPSA